MLSPFWTFSLWTIKLHSILFRACVTKCLNAFYMDRPALTQRTCSDSCNRALHFFARIEWLVRSLTSSGPVCRRSMPVLSYNKERAAHGSWTASPCFLPFSHFQELPALWLNSVIPQSHGSKHAWNAGLGTKALRDARWENPAGPETAVGPLADLRSTQLVSSEKKLPLFSIRAWRWRSASAEIAKACEREIAW